MKRGTLILAGLLAAQVGLAAILAFTRSDYAAYDAKDPLIAFDKGKVDQIAIDQSSGSSVTLAKQDGKWVIPSFAGFPADAQKVTALVDKLQDLKKGFPVATTGEAANRFKVSDSIHERRIVLSSGGKEIGKLYVGTSPSFKLANVRSGGDAIYSVALSAYEAGVRGEDWMDREVLAIPADQVSSIAYPDATLERAKDNKFALAGLKEGEKPLDGKVQDAARAILRPSFDLITGKGADELAKLNPPDIQVEVKKADGTSRVYKYKKEVAGGAYLFSASDRDYVFRVAEASVAAIADAKREKLIDKPAEKPAEKPAAAAQPAEPAPAPAPQVDKPGDKSEAAPAQPAAAAPTEPEKPATADAPQAEKPATTQGVQAETPPQTAPSGSGG
jgi:hypothetical protein